MKKAVLTMAVLGLFAVPTFAQAQSHTTNTQNMISRAEAHARESVGNQAKWNNLTSQEKSVLIQRADADLKRRNLNPNERHYPDQWQGRTTQDRDIIEQREGANRRTVNTNRNERHYPDKYQGMTSEQKDVIKQRESAGVYRQRHNAQR